VDGAAGAGETHRPPNGWHELLAYYGDIRLYIRDDGTLDPRWELENLKVAQLPYPLTLSWDSSRSVSKIRVHKYLVDLVEITFAGIVYAGLAEEVTEFGGAFAFRSQRGSHRLSLHAFGAALDLNPRSNPLGTLGTMNREVIGVFERCGWTWGGRWARPDPMHFQHCTGY
jgi:hypothetical protein